MAAIVTRLNDDISQFINVVDDWILYANQDDDLKIYKVRLDGSDRTKVSNDVGAWSLNIVGNWIYYDKQDDRKVYRIRTDGSDRQQVF